MFSEIFWEQHKKKLSESEILEMNNMDFFSILLQDFPLCKDPQADTIYCPHNHNPSNESEGYYKVTPLESEGYHKVESIPSTDYLENKVNRRPVTTNTQPCSSIIRIQNHEAGPLGNWNDVFSYGGWNVNMEDIFVLETYLEENRWKLLRFLFLDET